MQGRRGEAACQGAVKSRFCAFYTTSNVTEGSVCDLSSCPLILSSVFTRHAIFSWKSSFCFRNEGGWVPLPRRNSSGRGPGRGAGSGEAGWSLGSAGSSPEGSTGPAAPEPLLGAEGASRTSSSQPPDAAGKALWPCRAPSQRGASLAALLLWTRGSAGPLPAPTPPGVGSGKARPEPWHARVLWLPGRWQLPLPQRDPAQQCHQACHTQLPAPKALPCGWLWHRRSVPRRVPAARGDSGKAVLPAGLLSPG